MRFSICLAVFCALALHGLFLLFGGLVFPRPEAQEDATQKVDLLVAEPEKEPEKPEQRAPEEPPPDPEKPPDPAEVLRDPNQTTDDAPALEAASLAAIEAALQGSGGGGDFSVGLTFASGGRIGGTGRGGADDGLERAFGLAEIDQKPRPVFQGAPLYPAEMRGKKVEGVVVVLCVVDTAGKVNSPKIEKSNHVAFEQPALDAVRQWRFEPALRGGQRVSCKMRIPIRFPQA